MSSPWQLLVFEVVSALLRASRVPGCGGTVFARAGGDTRPHRRSNDARNRQRSSEETQWTARLHSRRPWLPLSGQRRRPFGGVLHDTLGLHARAPATSRIREHFLGRFRHFSQWSRSVWLASDAERTAARTRRLESHRAR